MLFARLLLASFTTVKIVLLKLDKCADFSSRLGGSVYHTHLVIIKMCLNYVVEVMVSLPVVVFITFIIRYIFMAK